MSRIHTLIQPRRALPLIAVIAVAVLVALALIVDPADRSGTRETSPSAGGSERSVGSSGGDLNGSSTSTVAPDGRGMEPAPSGVGALGDAAKSSLTEGQAMNAAAPDGDSASASVITSSAPSIDTRIVRNGVIELRASKGEFESTWGDAQAIAGTFGGYVIAATRSGAGKGPHAGTITMRIPSARFDRAVERIRGIDHTKLRRLDISSEDVTQEYVDVRSRLKHDRAVEGRLLALLAQTKGVSEVLAVQARLDGVQEQIEISQGRLDYLEKLTSMGTIELQLTEPAAAGDKPKKSEKSEPGVLRSSLTDARERFSENVASAVVWLGGALPALVMLLALAIGTRIGWRRHLAARATTKVGDEG